MNVIFLYYFLCFYLTTASGTTATSGTTASGTGTSGTATSGTGTSGTMRLFTLIGSGFGFVCVFATTIPRIIPRKIKIYIRLHIFFDRSLIYRPRLDSRLSVCSRYALT
ncbi:MAG: hypothetical protein EBU84_01625 [Actinobacteria bacterium]|nr:hypothetical protein [Actinomycetota bacterium]